MNRRQLKKELISVFKTRELADVFAFFESFKPRTLVNPLFTCLCHTDERIRWYSVSSFGYVVPKISITNLEDGRVVMRRFLWMLNDESGGIGWGVPEAMGEVMYSSAPLAKEYIHMLISYTVDDGPELYQDGNFIELPLLQQGVLWGLYRVAQKHKELLTQLEFEGNLGCYFSSPDSQVRGLACLLSGLLHFQRFTEEISAQLHDFSPVRLYQDGSFHDTTVSGLARRALSLLGQDCKSN